MNKYPLVFSIAGIVLLLDQATKWYIRHTISLYESIAVVDSVFHITHVRNSGGAFGLFAGASGTLRLPFFLMIPAGAIALLLFLVRRVEPAQHFLLIALGSILGGALGNLVDRMISGEVTDFLDLQWHGHHWPAFNVADSCITVGTLILLFHSLLVREHAGARRKA